MKSTKQSIIPFRKSINGRSVEDLKKLRDFLSALLKYKKVNKKYGTYITGVRKAVELNEEEKVYFTFNFDTVVTGRLSCSSYKLAEKGSKGVSFHTLSRTGDEDDDDNIRSMFIPDDGYVFITADFAAAELRVLAYCSGDENMIRAFQEGLDLHTYTASMIFDKEYDEVEKEERQIAKAVNFLIVYGGGPFKLAESINKPISFCKNIFKYYQESFPRIFDWMDKQRKFAHKHMFAVSPLGRRRNLPNLKSPNKELVSKAERQAVNFVIQSFASDYTQFSLVRIQEAIDKLGIDARILATVHDSIELQCRMEDIKGVCELLNYILPNSDFLEDLFGFTLDVPMKVDVEVGVAFGLCVEAVFDDDGRMINLDEVLSYINSDK